MKKTILALILISCVIFAQENFSNDPFSIYKSSGKTVIAGSVNTYVYNNYYGSNIRKEGYTNPHSKPEYLVYELFEKMKQSNLAGIAELYDTSFHTDKIDPAGFDMLSAYNDIRFYSKFKTGDYEIIRYDFVSKSDYYPYFAAVRNIDGKFYLTADINISDPFNTIGAFSPYNLPDSPHEQVDVSNSSALYFFRKDDEIYSTSEIPDYDYTAVYFSFDYYSENSRDDEVQFVNKIRESVQTEDSIRSKELISPEQQGLLDEDYYSSYYFSELLKIFRNSTKISPVAGLRVNDGVIIYVKAWYNQESSNIISVFLKQTGGKYYIALKTDDDVIKNILHNPYISKAAYNYFAKM
jgi:hypothetical protein